METSYTPGFRTLDEEVTDHSLDVSGTLPNWLEGVLVRNGPANFEVGGDRVAHWFDGLAMLHAFSFDGGVSYTNRYLRTEAYRNRLDGQGGSAFGSDGSWNPLSRLRAALVPQPTDNANVTVARLANRYVALTETPAMVEFDLDGLRTVGRFSFDDEIPGQMSTAHLQSDRAHGETWGFTTSFGRRHAYHLYRVANGETERDHVARIPVARPAYMHSFALTPSYAVLVEPPLVVNPFRFLLPSDEAFIEHYRWKPDRGTRFLVVDRERGTVVTERRAAAFFTFHTVNAFERERQGGRTGTEVVVDLVSFPDANVIDLLYLEELERSVPSGAVGTLERWKIPLGEGMASREVISEDGMELPRVSPTARMHPYRFVYGQTGTDGDSTGVTRVDVTSGETTTWREPGRYSGEPVFVPKPDGEDEADGVVLTVSLDVEAERSSLLVLDGRTLDLLARAHVPHHIPFGFHGEYFP